MKRTKGNSLAEEGAIQRGTAADAEAAEWMEKDFLQACRVEDVLPASMLTALTLRRGALRKVAQEVTA